MAGPFNAYQSPIRLRKFVSNRNGERKKIQENDDFENNVFIKSSVRIYILLYVANNLTSK